MPRTKTKHTSYNNAQGHEKETKKHGKQSMTQSLYEKPTGKKWRNNTKKANQADDYDDFEIEGFVFEWQPTKTSKKKKAK